MTIELPTIQLTRETARRDGLPPDDAMDPEPGRAQRDATLLARSPVSAEGLDRAPGCWQIAGDRPRPARLPPNPRQGGEPSAVFAMGLGPATMSRPWTANSTTPFRHPI